MVSDFVQLDSISVRKSERRAGFLYKYLYIVIPSHVEVIYQDDILLPVAVTGDIDRKSRLPVFHICRHLDSRSKETPPSVVYVKDKIRIAIFGVRDIKWIQIQCCMPCSYRFQVNFEKKGINQAPKTALFFKALTL